LLAKRGREKKGRQEGGIRKIRRRINWEGGGIRKEGNKKPTLSNI
jgi:hypothetical protein